jgi:signal transduction histidine kinase
MGQDVTVKVTTKGSIIVIFINDNGKGMDRETLEHVFIPFYTKKDRGTGLGMATAKRIIEEHRGSIAIRSGPGRGTQITIELPMVESEKVWTQNNVGGESGAA